MRQEVLTRREMFACEAMVGLLASGHTYYEYSQTKDEKGRVVLTREQAIASLAVTQADALIAELTNGVRP